EPNTLSLEEKKKKLQRLMEQRQRERSEANSNGLRDDADYRNFTYDMFMNTMGAEPVEIDRFNEWVERASRDGVYAFESARMTAQTPRVTIRRETGEDLNALNFSSYNYLGYGSHPEVIAAAKRALDVYGLGAASSPVISGTLGVHKQLEA